MRLQIKVVMDRTTIIIIISIIITMVLKKNQIRMNYFLIILLK